MFLFSLYSFEEKNHFSVYWIAKIKWLPLLQTMALSFRKDLEKYKDLDEDELLGNLSEVELKQLETVLDDLDPEVGARS